MKCPSCGATIGLEDKFCPFCGAANPYAVRHQAEIEHYEAEFEKTKEEVRTKTGHFARISARLIILIVLIAAAVASSIFAATSWEIGYDLQEKAAEENASRYRSDLEKLIEEKDYIAIADYWHANSLYMVRSLEEYGAVYSASSRLGYIFRDLIAQKTKGSWQYRADRLDYTADTLADYLSKLYSVQSEYSYNEAALAADKVAIIEDIQAEALVLLKTYTDLSDEDLEKVPTLSRIALTELLKEGLASRMQEDS